MTAIDQTPGSWIFSRDILAWLRQETLVKQLPIPYQEFAQQCNTYFAEKLDHTIPNGSQLFQDLIQYCKTKDLPTETEIHLGSFSIFVNLEDPRFFRVIHELSSEEEEQEILAQLLQPGDSFFDIGANHGSFSILATQILGTQGKILAVEAQPKLANLVRQSLAVNARCEFEVHQVALGDRQGEIEFMVPIDTSGAAGIFAAHSGTHDFQKLTVPLQTFDALIDAQDYRPHGLLKLDIEGSEYFFLKGAAKTIQSLQPTLFLEVNPDTLKASGIGIEMIKEILASYGYDTYAEITALKTRLSLADLVGDRLRNVVVFHRSHRQA